MAAAAPKSSEAGAAPRAARPRPAGIGAGRARTRSWRAPAASPLEPGRSAPRIARLAVRRQQQQLVERSPPLRAWPSAPRGRWSSTRRRASDLPRWPAPAAAQARRLPPPRRPVPTGGQCGRSGRVAAAAACSVSCLRWARSTMAACGKRCSAAWRNRFGLGLGGEVTDADLEHLHAADGRGGADRFEVLEAQRNRQQVCRPRRPARAAAPRIPCRSPARSVWAPRPGEARADGRRSRSSGAFGPCLTHRHLARQLASAAARCRGRSVPPY